MTTFGQILSWLKCRWPIVALLLISGCLNFYHLDWGLPNGATSWAYDALTPIASLKLGYYVLKAQLCPWGHYPAGHLLLLGAVNAPYIGYLFLTGQFGSPSREYPFGFADPERDLTTLFLMDRAVSALMGVGIVLIIYLLASRKFGKLAGLVSGASIALNTIFIYHSHTTNVDIPYLFWMMLSLYFFDRALESGQLRDFVLLSVFAAVSLCTKEIVVGVLVGMVIPLIWVVLRGRRLKELGVLGVVRAIADKRLLIGLAAFLITVGLVGCAVMGIGYWVAKFTWAMPQTKGSPALGSGQIENDVSLIPEIAREIAAPFGLPLAVLLVIGAVWSSVRLRARVWPYLILIASYYLVLQRNWCDHHYRFSMPQSIFVALLGAPLIAYLIQGRVPSSGERSTRVNRVLRLAPVKAVVCVVIAGVFGYTVIHGATLPWLLSHDPRYSAEAWLEQNTKEGQTIELLTGVESPRPPKWMTVLKIEDPEQRSPEKIAARGSDFVAVSGIWFDFKICLQDPSGKMVPLLKLFDFGALGYECAAMFKTQPFLDIPVSHSSTNPLIIIYRRSKHEPTPLKVRMTEAPPSTSGQLR